MPPALAKAAENKKKKLSTGKLIALIAAGVVVLAGIIVGVLALLHYNSPEQKTLRALEERDYTTASDIVWENESLWESELLRDTILERAAQIRQDYTDKLMSAEEAKDELNMLFGLSIFDTTADLDETYVYIVSVQSSRDWTQDAEEYKNNGNLIGAILAYRNADPADPEYQNVLGALMDAEEAYRNQLLETAEEQVDQGYFDDAIAGLEEGLYTLVDDSALLNAIAVYTDAKYEAMGNKAMEQAIEKVQSTEADFVGAVAILDETLPLLPEDAPVVTEMKAVREQIVGMAQDYYHYAAEKAFAEGNTVETISILLNVPSVFRNSDLDGFMNEVMAAHAEKSIGDAAALYEAGDMNAAIEVLKAAKELLPDNAAINSQLNILLEMAATNASAEE